MVTWVNEICILRNKISGTSQIKLFLIELVNLSLTHCLVLMHQPPSWTLTPFEFCIDEKCAHWNAQTKATKTK